MSLFKKNEATTIVVDKKKLIEEIKEAIPEEWYFFHDESYHEIDFILIKSISKMVEIQKVGNIFTVAQTEVIPFTSQIVLAVSIREKFNNNKFYYPWATEWVLIESLESLLRVLNQFTDS